MFVFGYLLFNFNVFVYGVAKIGSNYFKKNTFCFQEMKKQSIGVSYIGQNMNPLHFFLNLRYSKVIFTIIHGPQS